MQLVVLIWQKNWPSAQIRQYSPKQLQLGLLLIPDKNHKIDKARYAASLDSLYDIFTGISSRVNDISAKRCPYKNVEDRCTANFGCRNQDRKDQANDLYKCIGSDNLDYRTAWDL